jgi:hypothetical protein
MILKKDYHSRRLGILLSIPFGSMRLGGSGEFPGHGPSSSGRFANRVTGVQDSPSWADGSIGDGIESSDEYISVLRRKASRSSA